MKIKPSLLLLLFGVPLLLFPGPSTAQTADHEPLPTLSLTIPASDGYRNYLGLDGNPGDSFTLEDIDADVLLIQLFSMYCPFCQEEAPNVNALFEAMLDFSKPDFKVKIIGLGANNSEFEVDHYRNTFDVKFPLFADPDMHMYKALEGKGTPGFIGCRKGADNKYTIVLRQSGGFYQVEDFLNELLRKSGYN